jgi:hypothetical protein
LPRNTKGVTYETENGETMTFDVALLETTKQWELYNFTRERLGLEKIDPSRKRRPVAKKQPAIGVSE